MFSHIIFTEIDLYPQNKWKYVNLSVQSLTLGLKQVLVQVETVCGKIYRVDWTLQFLTSKQIERVKEQQNSMVEKRKTKLLY